MSTSSGPGLGIFALYGLAALSYSLGGAAMKASQGLRPGWTLVAVYACFGLGATIQTVSLARSELGVAYVVVLGLEAVVALSIATGWFGESFDLRKAVAILFILAGMILLS